MHSITEWLPQVINIARQAGDAIMQVYSGEIEVQKKEDNSPLTQADMAAHHIYRGWLKQAHAKTPCTFRRIRSCSLCHTRHMVSLLAGRPAGWHARIYQTQW